MKILLLLKMGTQWFTGSVALMVLNNCECHSLILNANESKYR